MDLNSSSSVFLVPFCGLITTSGGWGLESESGLGPVP
jgi:hypothetical protein